jgi:hypothetical protein
MTFDWHR